MSPPVLDVVVDKRRCDAEAGEEDTEAVGTRIQAGEEGEGFLRAFGARGCLAGGAMAGGGDVVRGVGGRGWRRGAGGSR